MNEPERQLMSLLGEAVEYRSPEERAAFLDRACAGDAERRARLEALLRAYEEAGNFLEGDRPPGAPGATVDAPISERPGTVIGPYKLLEQIGEGGMGTVWMAEQIEPIQRRVAVKVVKEGMDSRQVLARFEAERQALALMEHPNIAKVLDAGKTPSGRPYFVMELVKGQSITKHCDDKRLGVRQRLELFGDVCRAVQHAHQKGIIHRDLKPSNVLVAPYDGNAVVKVIDFGVAKATGQRLTDKTLFTGFGALVGTPEYMSPEQAEVNNQDIDTRSDVYSLGVLLYELLTGSTPLTRQRVKEVALLEVLRLIREEEPPRPSTRLSTTEELPSVAANRGLEPRKLSGVVRGELDWIVMKALEKDRNRRYETANGFAQDIQRYLADEPVQACPPSAWYRFRKFARRRKTALAVAGLILFFIAFLGGGGGWIIRERAAREQRLTTQVGLILAEVDRLERAQNWPEALAAAERADAALAGGDAGDAIRQRVRDVRRDLEFIARLDRIRQDVTFVQGKLDRTGAAHDYAAAFRDYGVDVEVLSADESVAKLRANPALTAPIAVALDEWALARGAIGQGESRVQQLVTVARALDPDPFRERLRAMWGQPIAARAQLLELIKAIDVKTQRPATLHLLADELYVGKLVEPSLQILREAQYAHPADFWLNLNLGARLSRRRDYAAAVRYASIAVSLRQDSAGAHSNLGAGLLDQGKLDEAVAECRKAIELDPRFASAHIHLGNALGRQKKVDEAIGECREAIKLAPKNAVAHDALGNVLHDKGLLDEAIAEYREAIRLNRDSAKAHNNLGMALRDKGQLDDAIAELREAIRIESDDALYHNNLGLALKEKDNRLLAEAIVEYEKAIKLDSRFALPYYNLGNLQLGQGKPDKALLLYQIAIALDPAYAMAHENLAILLCDYKHDYDGAIVECEKAIALNPEHAPAHYDLGHARHGKGDREGALLAYRKAIEVDRKFGPAYAGLGDVLRAKGDLDGAIAAYREAVKLDPKDGLGRPIVFPHNDLGVALWLNCQLDEAIAEFREAIRIDKNNAAAHNNLALALIDMGRFEEAIAECQEALRLKKDYPNAYCSLGDSLKHKGQFQQALQAYRRGHELSSRSANWHFPSAKWVRQCERLIELDEKLPAFLDGKTTPASSGEWIELAELCALKRLRRASARFYAGAFAAEPKLAEDLRAEHRYGAACAAVLAGCGVGADTGNLDEKAKSQSRSQALGWLRADLALHARQLATGKPADRAAAQRRLRWWLTDADLAGIRGPAALAKLPEAERQEWQKLWNDVTALLNPAQGQTASEKK
jgi:tetratricopeptide (TPR) repeat protein